VESAPRYNAKDAEQVALLDNKTDDTDSTAE